jgi:hypothetical protein
MRQPRFERPLTLRHGRLPRIRSRICNETKHGEPKARAVDFNFSDDRAPRAR